MRRQLAPRELASAARSSMLFSAVGAVLLGGLNACVPGFGANAAGRLATWSVVAVLIAITGVLFVAPRRLPVLFWAAVPSLVVATGLVLDLFTRDSSAAGQIFLCWPVLFAAYELRPRLAAAVLLEVLLADAVIVFSLRPVGPAASDLFSVGTTLGVFCLLLVRAREREARLVSELRRQVDVDDLTGLATRRALDEAMRDALGSTDGPVSLLLVDIDHFKAINDTWGHPAGDVVLQHVARLLREQFGGLGLVARLGGDEMAVLVPGRTQPTAAYAADAFRRGVAGEPAHLEGGTVTTTVSIGVAEVQRAVVAEADELYRRADEALYLAKNAGRNQVRTLPVETPETAPRLPVQRRPERRSRSGAVHLTAGSSEPAARAG